MTHGKNLHNLLFTFNIVILEYVSNKILTQMYRLGWLNIFGAPQCHDEVHECKTQMQQRWFIGPRFK